MVPPPFVWDASYVSEPEQTPLSAFLAEAIDALPNVRDHYDRKLQEMLNTKGKPIYDVQRGKVAKPGVSTLRAMAEVLGQPLDLLLRATQGEDVSPVPIVAHAPEQPLARAADGGEMVDIIRLDLSLPMGPGATVDEYVEEEPVAFDLSYIRAFTRTPPSRLRLARGIGESMYPTLNNNDMVWIDSTQRDLNQSDRVWAVSINGAAAIKRLRPLKEGRVLVISDNPAIDNYEVERDELLIGGRIIRFARDL